MEIKEVEAIPKEDGQYVYILKCADGTFYTGWTTNVDKRIHAHNFGTGIQAAKYTKSRRPVVLVYYEELKNKSEALKRENAIKKLPRDKKEELIKAFAFRK